MDIPSVSANISTQEIVSLIRRERGGSRGLTDLIQFVRRRGANSYVGGMAVLKQESREICRFALAERAGFEPAVQFPVHTLSKRAP